MTGSEGGGAIRIGVVADSPIYRTIRASEDVNVGKRDVKRRAPHRQLQILTSAKSRAVKVPVDRRTRLRCCSSVRSAE